MSNFGVLTSAERWLGRGASLTKDDVLAIEPGGHDGGDEELRAVRVGARVRHREEVGAVVLELEVLVWELGTVYALSARAIAIGEVSTLDHELLDDPVEGGALIAIAFLTGCESAEILRGLQARISYD